MDPITIALIVVAAAVAVAVVIIAWLSYASGVPAVAPPPRRQFRASIRQGKRGKWRFYIEDELGEAIAQSGVQGWQTGGEALSAVRRLSNADIVVVDNRGAQ